jgi:serine O-acetyltransferase
MIIALSTADLLRLVERQINHLFLFDPKHDAETLSEAIESVLQRCERCFAATPNRYYHKNEDTFFNPYHSGQYTIFLYYLSHHIFSTQGEACRSLADRLYYLNRCLNAVDLFYEVQMPDIFFLDHPVGSVMGRATYGTGFRFAQNCTVGNNKGRYPVIGRNVTMMAGATIIGDCTIGNDVVAAAGTFIKDVDIPSDSLVFGRSPALIVKRRCGDELSHL